MGYTTEFEGTFKLSQTPPIKVVVALHSLADESPGSDVPAPVTPWPDGYCQWELTRDDTGIKWDGNEKFYDYVEWLQAIIDNILTPAGIALSGEVSYHGEDLRDSGIIKIVDGKVVKEETSVVIQDLTAFKNFVLASDYGDELLECFQRLSKRKKG